MTRPCSVTITVWPAFTWCRCALNLDLSSRTPTVRSSTVPIPLAVSNCGYIVNDVGTILNYGSCKAAYPSRWKSAASAAMHEAEAVVLRNQSPDGLEPVSFSRHQDASASFALSARCFSVVLRLPWRQHVGDGSANAGAEAGDERRRVLCLGIMCPPEVVSQRSRPARCTPPSRRGSAQDSGPYSAGFPVRRERVPTW